MSDYFDRLTSQADDQQGRDEPQQTSEALAHVDQQTPLTEASHYTPGNVKATAQELLKYGLLEADRKPNLYQVATTQTGSSAKAKNTTTSGPTPWGAASV